MQPLDILIIGIAAWRISVFVTSGAGPWDTMLRFRELFGVEHDLDGNIQSSPVGGFGKLITCIWCFSLWAVAVLGAVWYLHPSTVMLFAAWGVVGIIEGLVFKAR